ncbi:hypothetical protein V2J09_015461, partial [Rumex salicifolius]
YKNVFGLYICSSVAAYKHPSLQDDGSCSLRDINKHTGLSHSDLMEVITSENGSKTMPSCIAFTVDYGILIGQSVQSCIRTLPYKVVNKENKPHIQVKFNNGETKVFSPEEICAFILGKLKEMAETFIGINEVKHAAVLVHHSYFNGEVEQRIGEACGMAGFEVFCVGSSQSAILLAKYLPKLTLVYDLGGSAFGVILLENYGVISSKGDEHLGGQTFDTRLVDYFVNLIETKYKKDISHDLNALRKLRIECEKAKITLSLVDDEMLLIEATLTRKTFEDLNTDLFNRTIGLVSDALKEGGMEKTDIRESNSIQNLVKNYFGKDPMYADVVNPNEALTFAATQKALPYGTHCVWTPVVVNTMAVGIETMGGVMNRFVEPLHILPTTMSRNVTTYYDGQTTIDIVGMLVC